MLLAGELYVAPDLDLGLSRGVEGTVCISTSFSLGSQSCLTAGEHVVHERGSLLPCGSWCLGSSTTLPEPPVLGRQVEQVLRLQEEGRAGGVLPLLCQILLVVNTLPAIFRN